MKCHFIALRLDLGTRDVGTHLMSECVTYIQCAHNTYSLVQTTEGGVRRIARGTKLAR